MTIQQKPFIPNLTFDEYRDYYKDRYEITRKNGIVEVKMHTNGGVSAWGPSRHLEWGDVIRAVGNDVENEVLILTAAGDKFESGMDMAFIQQLSAELNKDPSAANELQYDLIRVQERFYRTLLTDVDIPVIAAINGPGGEGGHMEFMLFSDIRICAPDVVFGDPHFALHGVPGGGAFTVLQAYLGTMRAAHMVYTGEMIDANKAQEWGLIDEVVDRENLNKRAWELAEDIMKKPRAVRRMTHEIMRKPLREYMNNQIVYFNSAQSLGSMCARSQMV